VTSINVMPAKAGILCVLRVLCGSNEEQPASSAVEKRSGQLVPFTPPHALFAARRPPFTVNRLATAR